MKFCQVCPRDSHAMFALQYHPDKHPKQLSAVERAAAVEQFQKIAKAYEILSDAKLRQEFDVNFTGKICKLCVIDLYCAHVTSDSPFLYLSATYTTQPKPHLMGVKPPPSAPPSIADQLTQTWPIGATVDLDDMTFDPSGGTYSTPCRCGGGYTITEGELERGMDTVPCSTCTLSIRVLYRAVEDGEDNSDEEA